ncbi:serine/threonine protein kinase, partial [bacterium]
MAGSDENRNSTLELNSGFLELDSMASMQRVGDSQVAAFAAGGSTLLDLDGLSEKTAKKAAAEARSELATGHHESERYRVLHEIARGGMGAVLEVHDSDLDRKVAMKVLLRDTRKSGSGSGSDGDGQGKVSTGPVERFIAEAQLTGSLEHPNIVPVHELGLDSQGRVYFTMKRVRGRSLRGVLDKLRQGHAPTLAEFTPAHLLNVLLKVCDAIEFAHSKGIVHRDLKPENIMVGEFGEVLVMDWGLAKQIDSQAPDAEGYKLDVSLGASDDDSTRTREGTVSGTPAYMSPEQARGEISQVDQRTDVFCLGAMLYETLCLVPPFLAPTMTGALDAAREHRLLPPRRKLDEVLADKDLARAFSAAGRDRARRHAPELVAIALKAMAEKR